jgi:hypothetical protein
MPDEPALHITDARLSVPEAALDDILAGRGVTLRLEGLSLRLSQEALSTLLRRALPAEQWGDEPTATVTAGGIAVEGAGGTKRRVDLQTGTLRVEFTDGALTLTTGGG